MIRQIPLLLLFLLGACAPADRLPSPAKLEKMPEIGGILSESRTISGDYRMSVDLQIPAGISLTLEAGTRIFVVFSDSTKIDPEYLSRETEILVRGQLLIRGTRNQPVWLLPAEEPGNEVRWGGITLVDGADASLEHLRIAQAETALLCLNSSPRVIDLRAERCRYGILLQQQSAAQVSDSRLADGEAGIFCWDQSAPRLSRVVVEGNSEEGVYLAENCKAEWQDLVIRDNDRGLVQPAGRSIASGVALLGNRQDLLSYPVGGQQ